jgi:hypothetical protein
MTENVGQLPHSSVALPHRIRTHSRTVRRYDYGMRTQTQPVEDRRSRPVRAALEHHAFRLKLADAVQVGAQCVGALAGMCLIIVVLDHAFPTGLPMPLIRGAGLLLLSLLVVAAFTLVARYARGFNKLFVARDFEKSRGVANNVVLNLLLIGQGRRAKYAFSAGAVQAAAEVNEPHGEVRTQPHNATPWAALGGVALAWIVFALITPKEIGPSLRRLLGSSEAAPSATRIELLRPSAKDGVYAGEPLTMEFALRGRAAGPLTVELLDGPGPDAPALVRHTVGRTVAGEPDDRSLTLAGNEIGHEVRFRAKAGDAMLTGVINVQPEPDVLEYHVHVTPPAYLGLAATETKSAEVQAIAGTEAVWRIAANCPMTHPIFVFKGATETRTRMNLETTDGRVASLSLPLTESGEYRIEFKDSFGRTARRGGPHRVVVRGDRAPRVEITEPGTVRSGGDAVDLADAPWLRVAASDDWSLRSLELVIERQGTTERRDLMPNSSAGRPGETVQVGVASADIELKIGQTVRAWFEAKDNRHAADGKPAPQIGQSRVVTLRRSADTTVAKHSKKKDETEVVSAEPGQSTVVAGKKERGSGQGDDKTATGDGPGDNPSDKGGAAGGSTRVSNQGTPAAAQNDENADPENMVSIGQESGPADGNKGGKDSKENDGQDAGANGKGNGDGDGDPDGDHDGSFDERMKNFIEQHGKDAEEAKKALDRKGGVTEDAKTSSPPKEREDSTEMNPPQGETPPSQANDTPTAPQDGEPKPNEKKSDATPKPEGPQSTGEPKPEPGQNPSDARTPPQPGEKQPADETGKGQNEQKESGDKNAKDGKDSNDKGSGEKPADKGADADANAKKPQPNAPGDSKNESAKPEPKPSTPEPNAGNSKASDPQSGGDGRRAESDELPPPGADEGTAAEPGAIPMPGAKVKSEGVEPPPTVADSDSSSVEKDTKAGGPRAEVVNVLELLERIESSGDDALDDLPWPAERKAAFLRELKRLEASAKRSGVLADVKKWKMQAKLGSSQVQRGSGVAGDVGLGVGGEAMEADSLEKLAAPADQRVPEHLRAVLEAYYRSLAEKRARDK